MTKIERSQTLYICIAVQVDSSSQTPAHAAPRQRRPGRYTEVLFFSVSSKLGRGCNERGRAGKKRMTGIGFGSSAGIANDRGP
ncbi:hypothetical protein EVAR_65656_1 [Eumeta japonica]|uniref:Uncharacterized protein n=1 Tax=Eumeta variegata TaxID=151549 RepID=A0A4C1Z6R2_EUMVA|nr:hypothetical protein EVAR_65656_1 [Eumeta japonica]